MFHLEALGEREGLDGREGELLQSWSLDDAEQVLPSRGCELCVSFVHLWQGGWLKAGLGTGVSILLRSSGVSLSAKCHSPREWKA